MENSFLDIEEFAGLDFSEILSPLISQPECVTEIQNLNEIDGIKAQKEFNSGNKSFVELSCIDGIPYGNSDSYSDEDLMAEAPHLVIPQSQPTAAAVVQIIHVEALEPPVSLEQLQQVSFEEQTTTVDETANEVEQNAPPAPEIIQQEVKPKRNSRRAPKRKKYMEDPSTDETGKVKNAINAKLNREKKKKEWQSLISRAESAETKLQQKEMEIAELSSKLQVCEQEKTLLALRAQEAEAKLAKHSKIMNQMYSEICLDFPQATDGSQIVSLPRK